MKSMQLEEGSLLHPLGGGTLPKGLRPSAGDMQDTTCVEGWLAPINLRNSCAVDVLQREIRWLIRWYCRKMPKTGRTPEILHIPLAIESTNSLHFLRTALLQKVQRLLQKAQIPRKRGTYTQYNQCMLFKPCCCMCMMERTVEMSIVNTVIVAKFVC